jgi:hypothetical protein
MGYSVTPDALKFYLKTARETTVHRAITRIEQSIVKCDLCQFPFSGITTCEQHLQPNSIMIFFVHASTTCRYFKNLRRKPPL